MTQHTPGPWKVSKNGTAINSADGAIAHVSGASVWFDNHPEQIAANAALIAAAPDLLAALIRVSKGFVHPDLVNKVTAAIAKAGGVA